MLDYIEFKYSISKTNGQTTSKKVQKVLPNDQFLSQLKNIAPLSTKTFRKIWSFLRHPIEKTEVYTVLTR